MDLKIQCFGDRLFNYIPEYFIVAYNLEKKVIGYSGLEFTENELHIDSLCVDKHYRFNGIGRNILEKAYDIAKIQKINKISLEVDRSKNYNELSKFYDKCGFKGDIVNGYSFVNYIKFI
jgi:ribosomal protein S18 acetylase RimI-like enzyme